MGLIGITGEKHLESESGVLEVWIASTVTCLGKQMGGDESVRLVLPVPELSDPINALDTKEAIKCLQEGQLIQMHVTAQGTTAIVDLQIRAAGSLGITLYPRFFPIPGGVPAAMVALKDCGLVDRFIGGDSTFDQMAS